MIPNTIKYALASSLALWGHAQAAVQGFDISHYQSSVDFAKAYSSGARFVIIKVRHDFSHQDLVARGSNMSGRLPKAQLISTPSSQTTTPGPQTPNSSVVAITLLTQAQAREPAWHRQTTFLRTAVVGQATAKLCPVCSTWKLDRTVNAGDFLPAPLLLSSRISATLTIPRLVGIQCCTPVHHGGRTVQETRNRSPRRTR